MMQRQPVASSNLRSVGYDRAQNILEIEFQGGRVYRYLGVPEDVHLALMGAGSKGTYFSTFIKDRYPTQRT